MTPERFRRLEELFLRLEPLDAEARHRVLEADCAGDPDLRRQVEGMLGETARAETDDWIARSIREELPELREAIPERLGRYRVLGEIGRGGLATVLAAERDDDEYHQQVAIKLIRRGLDTEDLLRRLRLERQILARLQHPNIASLIDGGSTDDGRPFVVMEYIDGRPIDEYCSGLPLGRKLELFLAVCEAVQSAHRSLVIHRDIKPANILVTPEGQPKLLDFGIAKLLESGEPGLGEAVHTSPGSRLLTPEYASPEQVRGEPLTTASDVYSLGVLLYELLSGQRPYRVRRGDQRASEGLHGSPAERPSARLRARAARAEARAVAGDLDNIVLKALRPEPERRYGSVEQLAEDLKRYLGNLPVRARADTFAYRLSKFIRRHRVSVAIASLSAVLLVTVSLVAVRQARLADLGRLEAERLSDFLVEIFEWPDPAEALGRAPTAREILDRGAEKVHAFRGQPEVQASILHTMGRAYRGLGQYESAAEVIERAVELRARGEPLDSADSLDLLGEVRFSLGDVDEAERLFEQALRLRWHELGPERPELAQSYANLGAVSFSRRDFVSCESQWARALELGRTHLGDHGDVAELHDNMGTLRQAQGLLEQAEDHLRRALDLHARHHGETHPETVRTLANLAALLHSGGDLEAAEPIYRRALEGQIQVLGADHPQVALTSANMAALLTRLGHFDEAETLLRGALHDLGERLGAGHIETTHPMIHLADLLLARGAVGYREAEALYREVHRIRAQHLAEDHLLLGDPLLGLGRLELRRGNAALAAHALEGAQAIFRASLGPEHAETLEAGRLLRLAREGEAASP